MLPAVILFFYNHRFGNNNRLSHPHSSELLRTSHGTQSHSYTPPISAPIYHRPPCSTPPPPISAPTAPQQKTLFITFWRPMRQTDLIIVCNGLRKNFSFFCVKNRFLAKGRGGTPRLRPFAVAVFYFRTMQFMRFRA